MATAAQRLAELGYTVEQVQTWLFEQTDPGYVLTVCQLGGITNEMLGEIAGYPGPPYTPQQVRAFFAGYGFDSSILDAQPIVTSVSSPTITEGGALQHTVVLSGVTTSATEYSLAIELGTVSVSDFSGYALTNGVALASFTSLMVPAGVSSFTFTLNSANDSSEESNESYSVRIGGVGSTGTITDNDAAAPEVEVQSFSGAWCDEGGDLVHSVVLTATTGEVTHFTLNLGGGTADSSDWGAVSADHGVVISGTDVTVPAGVSTFSITIETVDDAVDEGDEAFLVEFGGVFAGASIYNNDGTVVPVTVASVSSPEAAEGTDLVHTVTLSAATTEATSFTYTVGGGTSSVDDWSGVTADNGVTIEGNQFVVPTGVSTFAVHVATVNDTADESDETVVVTVGGMSGTGTIQDNDEPALPEEEQLWPDNLMDLVLLLSLNTNSGSLSNASLRTAVIAQSNEAHYMELFDPTGIDGWEDGTWTTEELGFSHLGNLPATVESLESLFYGTYLHIFKSLDLSEAQQIDAFFAENQEEIMSGDPAVLDLYIDLILDATSDPGQLVPDFLIPSILVPIVVEMVNLVGTGHYPDIFDSLPIGG